MADKNICVDNQRYSADAPVVVSLCVPPLVSNGSVTFARMNAAIPIAFIINYAAYFSEIFRGGIESVPKGQYEAGQVLGMTKGQIFFKVVLFAGCKENYCTHGQRNYLLL